MVLASSCELLLENPALDQRGRTQVERIHRASEEMRELVQTFLMLARTQREDTGMSPRLSLGQVGEDLVGLWRGPIESKGLTLIFEPGQTLDTLYNATFLTAVMGNLLRNALHYTDQGFIRLTLNATGFVVEDSGVGIPEEKREAMFEPFVRGNEKRGEGLGLGLSLVQRICENQGWTVSLSTMEPNGCHFEVELNTQG
jgi:signal transduction histidine kinase